MVLCGFQPSHKKLGLNLGEIMVQAVVVPDFFSVMQGWVGVVGNLRLTVSGLSSLKIIEPKPSPALPVEHLLYPTDSVTLDYPSSPGSVCVHGRGWGGAGAWRYFARGRFGPDSISLDARMDPSVKFPLASDPIRITPGSAKTMDFTGGQITVEFRSLNHPPSDPPYQTFVLRLPDAHSLPVPKITAADTTAATKEQWWSFSNISIDAVTGAGRVANAWDLRSTRCPVPRRILPGRVRRGASRCPETWRFPPGRRTTNGGGSVKQPVQTSDELPDSRRDVLPTLALHPANRPRGQPGSDY